MKMRGRHRNKLYAFAGGGMALGAAFGILFGLLLFNNPWVGPIVGGVLGLVIGAGSELSSRRRRGQT